MLVPQLGQVHPPVAIGHTVLSRIAYSARRAGARGQCGLRGELLAKESIERKEPDSFDREGVLVGHIELAAALVWADVLPVGGFVAGAAESIRLHEVFQQRGAVAVALLPVGR